MKIGDLVNLVFYRGGVGIVTKLGLINHCVLFEDGEHWYHRDDLELISESR